jgi:hypothetical protein
LARTIPAIKGIVILRKGASFHIGMKRFGIVTLLMPGELWKEIHVACLERRFTEFLPQGFVTGFENGD